MTDVRGFREVERFDRGEFAPGTRGAAGLCTWCDGPAEWMLVSAVFDVRYSRLHSRRVIRKSRVTAFCADHAAPYRKHQVDA